MSIVRAYLRLVARWRWSLLLGLLIAAFLLQPVWSETGLGQIASFTLFSLVFGGAVFAGRTTAWAGRAVIAMLALGFALQILDAFGVGGLKGILAGVGLAIVLGALVATFAELVHGHKPDIDSLVGAVFGFFVIAAAWMLWFVQLEVWDPGSFSFAEGADLGTQLLYFSLVTVTTVGYGDILPVTSIARLSAGFEAAIGTLYIAILIGRVVGQFKYDGRSGE